MLCQGTVTYVLVYTTKATEFTESTEKLEIKIWSRFQREKISLICGYAFWVKTNKIYLMALQEGFLQKKHFLTD